MGLVDIGGRSTETGESDRFVQQVAVRLLDELPAVAARLSERILTEDPYYAKVAASTDREVRRAVDYHLTHVVRGLAGLEPIDLDPVRDLARRGVAQGVPIAALLNAFRLAAQIVWEQFTQAGHTWAQGFDVDAVLDGSAVVWALYDSYAGVISRTYDEALVEQARRSHDEQTLLFDALLQGRDVSVVADAARILDLPEQGALVAVVAEVATANVDPLPAIDQSLRALGARSAWRPRDARKTGVVVVGPGTERDRVRDVEQVLAAHATSRIGISAVYRQLSQTACSVRLAEIALGCRPPGDVGVSCFDDHPVDILIAGSPKLARHAARIVLSPVLALSEAEQATLLGTLTAWIDEGGSVSRAGERLFCHRNTVRNRLQRIGALTGRSLTEPNAIAEIVAAVHAINLRPEVGSPNTQS